MEDAFPDNRAESDAVDRWFVRHEGVRRGPYTSTQVRRLLLSEALSLSDEVSRDGHRWQPLTRVPEVVPHQFRRDAQACEQELLQEAGAGRRQALAAVLVLVGLVVGILVLVLQLDAPGGAGADCSAPPAPGVNWQDCRFTALVAPRADLRSVWLGNAKLPGASLQGAVLAEGDLRYADLKAADLSYADLRDARLMGADLRAADLTYSDLRGADLSFADLRDARMGGARLDGALLRGALWIDGRVCPDDARGGCGPPAKP